MSTVLRFRPLSYHHDRETDKPAAFDVISGFCRGVMSSSLFWDVKQRHLFLYCLTLEDGTNTMSRNVDNYQLRLR